MTLKIGHKAIVDRRALARIPNGEAMLDKIDRELESKGIRRVRPPGGDAPKDLTEVDVSAMSILDLESLYAKYVAWNAYIESLVTRYETLFRFAQNNLAQVKKRVEKALMATSMPKGEVPSARDTHPEVELATNAEIQARAFRDTVESAAKVYSKQAAALSRVIEIRKLEFEQSGRVGNMNVKNRGQNLHRTAESDRLAARAMRGRDD